MTFQEAVDGVKIGHFVRKGGKIRGVVHVGANDGEEIPFYLALGAKKVLAFEPNLDAWANCISRWNYPEITVLPIGLGSICGVAYLIVTEGDGKGSSFLLEKHTPYEVVGHKAAPLMTFRQLNIDLTPYNTLVIDVQGMEWQVLVGFREFLSRFDFVSVECSRVPLFHGEKSAQEIIDYLSVFDFIQDSPIEDHNDIMFIRKGVTFPE